MPRPNLKLYSHDYGPGPHMVRIALAEMGMRDVETQSIDTQAKPRSFLRVSPTGKTPLLMVDGEPIWETSVILEYVADLSGEELSLQAKAPLARARNRSWTLFALDLVMDAFGGAMAADEESHRRFAEALTAKLSRLEVQVGDGPYFSGETVALIDFVFAALFLRLKVFEESFGWDILTPFPKLRKWSELLLARPLVRGTVPDDFEESVTNFIRRTGSHVVRSIQ